MKKLLFIILLIIVCYGAAACTGETDIPWELGEVADYSFAASLEFSVIDGTLTNTGAEFLIKNNSDMTYELAASDDYRMAVFTDGAWRMINVFWDVTAESYTLLPNESITFSIDFYEHFGELPMGKYRIIKEAALYGEAEPEREASYFICDFEIG